MAFDKTSTIKYLGDATQLKKTIEDIKKDTQKFNDEIQKTGINWQKVGAISAAAGAAVLGTIAVMVTKTTEMAGRYDDLSKKVGITAEEFQRLAFAGRQAGVENEAFAESLIKMQKTAGDTPDTFAKLGIALKDVNGNFRSTTAILGDVAEKVKNTHDPIARNNILMDVFGKTGAKLNDVLSGGRQGLEDYGDQAQRLGIIISNDSIAQFDQLGDSVDAIKESFGGFSTQASSDLVPVFNMVAEAVKGALEVFHAIPAPLRQIITVSGAVAAGVALIGGAALVAAPAIWAMIAPILPFVAAAAGIAAVAVLISQNWNACLAFLRVVWDKLQLAGQIAFSAIKTYLLTEMFVVMKGLEVLFSWVPGLGTKIKEATRTIGNELKQEAQNVVDNTKKLLNENKYDQYYKELEAKTKKKTEVTKVEEEKTTKIITLEEQKRIKEAQEAAEKRLDIERDWHQKLLQEIAKTTTDKINLIDIEEKKEIEKANTLGAATTDIEAYYAEKRLKIYEEDRKSHEETYKAKSEQLISYLDQLSEGTKSLKDIIKEQLIAWLNSEEVKILASIAAGIAAAWAEAPFTWGASLAWIPSLLSSQGVALAAIEVGKAAIRGLATGGTLTSTGDVLIGERGPEILRLPQGASVIPLNHPAANVNNNNQKSEVHLHVGTLVADKLGLKQLERMLSTVRYEELARRGEQ